MERGALLRKHGIDGAVLCLILCISFFAAGSSYSDEAGEDPIWYAYSDIYYYDLYDPDIYATAQTMILPEGYAYYQAAHIDSTLTKNGIVQASTSPCQNEGGVTWGLPKSAGIWALSTDYYLSGPYPDCPGTYVGSTYDESDQTQVLIDYFYASPLGIPPSGGSTTLYWSTINGTSFNINGTPVSGTGSLVVNLTSSTIYTLTASNAWTSTQYNILVRVNEPLNPNFYRYSVHHEKGLAPFFPYAQVEQESVNLANGNLFFTVPLLSRPGRNGLGIDLKLAYNSKVWDFYVQGQNLYATLPEYDSWVGLGWTLTMGRIIDDSANGYYYMTSADGANHTLKYYGGAWRSVDSTYMVYDPVAHRLTLKGGVTLQFDCQDISRPYMRYATKVSDANGNYLTITYADTGGRIDTIQDTLGNTYSFILGSNSQLEYISYWTTNDTSYPTGTISLDYVAVEAYDPMLAVQRLLSHVTYIEGQRYCFDYNEDDLLSVITYPTLGVSRYNYDAVNLLDRNLGRTVQEFVVYSHDTGDYTGIWYFSNSVNEQGIPISNTIYVPGQVNTVHWMNTSSSGWADGFVTKIEKADSLSKDTTLAWTQDDEQLTTILNPRVSWIKGTTKLTSAPYTEKSQRVEYSYAATNDYSGNVKEIREYGFDSGPLRRKTVLTYLHESNGSYIPLNILDRVTSTLIYDGSNNLISKTTTAYDGLSLYDAPNAINHDSAYGTGYLLRGLPTSTTGWYNIAQNLFASTSTRYDICGNAREATDPRSNVSYTEYWINSNDNAYAFPRRTVNARGHITQATYSYKSGFALTGTDANNQVTTMTYDGYDRITQITRPNGGKKKFIYVESSTYEFPPYVIIRQYLTSSTYTQTQTDLDNMGRFKEETALDDIKRDQQYNTAGSVANRSLPHISGQTAYRVNYSTGGVASQSVSYPDGTGMVYYNGPDSVRVERNDGAQKVYSYQEDGNIRNVLEQDPATGDLNVGTDYYYDAMGRLAGISQGVQARTFTYDDLGRMLSETVPERGTTSYVYDAASNVISKTDARGVVTGYSYDELNRVTQKSYSDGTPAVSYFYDSQPGDSPIVILNPVGRVTKVSTVASGVAVSSYYSYCNCSAVNQEATIINDGTPKTYITDYTYNLAGQLTSMTYPSGKTVNYTRDSHGRETKVSSTYNGQAFYYIFGASYGGPQGALTDIVYPIGIGHYTYSPSSLLMTGMTINTYAGCIMDLSFSYTNASSQKTRLIQDITDDLNPERSEHFEYDKWDRLVSYWVSETRSGQQSRSMQVGYDRYGNVTGAVETINGQANSYSFSVDPATNRLTSRTYSGGTMSFSYDNAGNMTSKGTFDGESRLVARNGMAYLYDGGDRRVRKQQGGTVINYVYSFSGQLLVEDNLTTESSESYVYFNGQMVAIQGDNESSFKLLMKDRMGSTRKTYTVTVPGYGKTLNETYKYDPWGQIIYSSQSTPPYTDIKYQEKERENDLDYFGARYYDALSISNGSSMRWISTDPVTSRVFDPQSLNKYSYVRNDPVNLVDPDGRAIVCFKTAFNEEVCIVTVTDSFPRIVIPSINIGGMIGAGGSGPKLQPLYQEERNAVSPGKRLSPLDPHRFMLSEKYFDEMKSLAESKDCRDFLTGLFAAVNPSNGMQLYNGLLTNLDNGPWKGPPILIKRNEYSQYDGKDQVGVWATTRLVAGEFTITLWKPFFNGGDGSKQMLAMMHEEVHAAGYGVLDSQIAAQYGWKPDPSKTDYQNESAASGFWHNKLSAACKPYP